MTGQENKTRASLQSTKTWKTGKYFWDSIYKRCNLITSEHRTFNLLDSLKIDIKNFKSSGKGSNPNFLAKHWITIFFHKHWLFILNTNYLLCFRLLIFSIETNLYSKGAKCVLKYSLWCILRNITNKKVYSQTR